MRKLNKEYAGENFFFSSKSVSVPFFTERYQDRYNSVQFFHCVKRPVSQPSAAIKDVKLIFLPCLSSPACRRTRSHLRPTECTARVTRRVPRGAITSICVFRCILTRATNFAKRGRLLVILMRGATNPYQMSPILPLDFRLNTSLQVFHPK